MSQTYSSGSARARLAPLLTLAMTACTAATGSTNQELDLDPTTLDDAAETLSQIDAMLAADPLDEEALAALEVRYLLLQPTS